jgi:hypothetical protein
VRPLNPYAQMHRHLSNARRALVRAGAALTEIPSTQTLEFAIFETVMALLSLAKADTDEKAKDHLLARFAAHKAAQAERSGT